MGKELKQALFRRGFPKNVLIYSDWVSQYCSTNFKQLLLLQNEEVSK